MLHRQKTTKEQEGAGLPVVERALAAEGVLILSGIVEWILPKVQAAYGEIGFHTVGQRQSEEWVTLVMKQEG